MINYPWLEELTQKLDQLLSSKVLILEGPKGLGKKEIAHEIAKHKSVSYTHLRAHETTLHLVCRLLLEKKK